MSGKCYAMIWVCLLNTLTRTSKKKFRERVRGKKGKLIKCCKYVVHNRIFEHMFGAFTLVKEGNDSPNMVEKICWKTLKGQTMHKIKVENDI